MALIDEIKAYTDEDGIVLPKLNTPNPEETGNNLYTWIFYYLLWKRHEHREPGIRESFSQLAGSLFVPGYPGLMYRSISKTEDQQSHDDYIWLCLASQNLDFGLIASKVCNHGINYGSTWNNVEPRRWTVDSWFGRMPWFICHFYYASFKDPPLRLKLFWTFRILFLGIFGKHSNTSWLLSYAMVKSRFGTSFIDKYAIKLWSKRMNKLYPNGFVSVLREHLDEAHPLVKYWVNDANIY